MSPDRRRFLRHAAALTPLAVGSTLTAGLGLALPQLAQAADYRALMVIFLKGGYDGNDMLVPRDGGYADYQRARPNLALRKDELVPIAGYDGGSLGMHPAFAPLRPLYEQGRMAWVANVGPLVRPASVGQVLANQAEVPPFLMSHSEQVNIVQGWNPAESLNGWGGRGMEELPSDLVGKLPVTSFAFDNTLVTGLRSRMTLASSNSNRYWGSADLGNPNNKWTQIVESMGQLQSKNLVENEFARSLGASFADTVALTLADSKAGALRTAFPDSQLARDLAYVARLMPVFKSEGVRRQLFFTDFGSFDTHVSQRGDDAGRAMDVQMDWVARALAAWDAELRATGMDREVLTLVMTEFGRTLQPAGAGTDHAWGNHWFALGAPVRGGRVHGRMPSLVLGGADDGDPYKKGRWVPDYASDQFGATAMQWLGLPADKLVAVFPNLANFPGKTVPYLA